MTPWKGYDSTPRSSASDGCRCTPTQKQLDDYQVPLVEAVRRWDMGALEALAADGVDMGASNRFGESIVHLATRRGSTPVLRFLLSHGGSLRICDDYGKTPLHDAFWTAEPRFELVAMMLEMDWGLLRATDARWRGVGLGGGRSLHLAPMPRSRLRFACFGIELPRAVNGNGHLA
ncbi:conserved unknown protein [Ectocarpus siliculosus]|uniref:Uncharacterized protein n=1 Tax=Ectocarpus siliculosus TaxID=2880 RepID=D8LSZ7_ECTSI|nr:conserved unknown protein [Ectocarpus siliculosus]|eukprot:CBN77924.1 conserved unknown protein [Ectocarpus siliculosus]